MDRIAVANLMEEQGMVPLFYHNDLEESKRLLQAIYDGGGRLLEFTSRGQFAHEIFGGLRKYADAHLSGMALGVGSVTDAAAASLYMGMGADFIVTPVLRHDIAVVCNRRKVLWSPGCGSLTEICAAEELGCEIVKLFPGGTYGPGFVKAIRGPQPWTKVMPTGGVAPTQENLQGWFDAGVTCVGMGSKLVSKDIVRDQSYDELSNKVREALALIRTIRAAV